MFVVLSQAWRDQAVAYRLGGDYRIQGRKWTNEDIRQWQQAPSTDMAVPEHANNIGWEVDFGCDWKLLEGLTWSSTFAIWKPGNWWAHAFPNTANMYRQTSGQAITANQPTAIFDLGREIDPLFAVETRINISF